MLLGPDAEPVVSPSVDPLLVEARRILLVGLAALSGQQGAITVIGAQAVFEHTRSTEGLPFTLTVDADTCVSPSLVRPDRDMANAMRAAGFVPSRDRPGIWGITGADGRIIGFDLLVPETVAGPGRRGARVAGQDRHALGRAAGLELSLLDRELRTIAALDRTGRSVDAYLAGPAAIMCAKAYKLTERLSEASRGGRNRVKAKDAGDVWRLMEISDAHLVRSVFAGAERSDHLGPAIARGRSYLDGLFSPDGLGTQLAATDLADQVGEDRVVASISRWMAHFRR